jgi:hypothetical protein
MGLLKGISTLKWKGTKVSGNFNGYAPKEIF